MHLHNDLEIDVDKVYQLFIYFSHVYYSIPLSVYILVFTLIVQFVVSIK